MSSDYNIWFVIFIIGQVSNIPYNQPNFCSNASWDSNGTTFTNINITGLYPLSIFINKNNTIYIPNRNNNRILVWSENNMILTGNISINSSSLYNLFVTEMGDIYIDASSSFYGITKWSSMSSNPVQVMFTCRECNFIFIDINNNIYCSMRYYHQVVKKSLDIASNALSIIAGTGSTGSTSTTLNEPYGIFVDDNFDLYVADTVNNRIQLFHSGDLSATTVAGLSNTTILLIRPTSVVLDANKYLFIVDHGNSRVIGSSANGYRCIIGCSGGGSTSDKLLYPISMTFDSYGNIYVADQNNHRIQKFLLLTGLCNETRTINSTSVQNITTNVTETIANGSYNQPKFDTLAHWDPVGITFTSGTTVGTNCYSIFIDQNNTIYVGNTQYNRIQIWLNGSASSTKIISTNLTKPYALFISYNGDIYTSNNYPSSSYRVDRRQLSSNSSVTIMSINADCFGLFVDIVNNFYCSLTNRHQVVKKLANSISQTLLIVAGVGCATAGSGSNALSSPYGIFVDINFDLYVADCGNDRIQLFSLNELKGKTVAGSNSAITTITLDCPTGILLDADKYLYIVDKANNRIVRSNANGFRCIIGCYSSGNSSNLLSNPHSMAFDNNGNIYVIDFGNNRIQKFLLLNNSNELSYNAPKLCASASWNSNGITFTNYTTIGSSPIGIYIDANNTIYVASQQNGRVHIWLNGSVYRIKTISHAVSTTFVVFITFNGDIFATNQYIQPVAYTCLKVNQYTNQIYSSTCHTFNYYYYIDKMIPSTTSSTIFNTINGVSYGVFVDISNNFYYSLISYHQVFKKPLYSSSSSLLTVAGTGLCGSTPTTLCYPRGIFVDDNFDLYVADSRNARIQLFRLGELSATTVAGSGSPTTTISLCWPTSVVLDEDKYLFIVDSCNHRIVASSANGFRCIIGCLGWGETANKLRNPWSMAFDSYGNIYVTDLSNSRIQKFVVSSESCLLSYNRPKFCSSALWYSNGTTFASNSIIGSLPSGIFVDTMNTVYVVSRNSKNISAWYKGDSTSLQTRPGDLNNSSSIFVSYAGNIYVDNGLSMNQITKWISNSNTGIVGSKVNGSCSGLFIDTNETIYCSQANFHRVIQMLLDGSTNESEIVAGNGLPGSSANQLNSPRGIFVHINFDLYIADCNNNRIQLFLFGESIGISLAENFSLNCPTHIVLDGDDYLFIVDSGNNRIIGSSADGFRCIIGCLYSNDSSTQLNSPQTMAFDSYGNIYVTDTNNNRIQKFTLEDNLCIIPEPTEAPNNETTGIPWIEIEIETTSSMPEMTSTTITSAASATCYSPIVSIIPDGSSLLSPIPFRRSQDSYLMSLIELNCNISLTIKIQWTIINCTLICSNTVQLDKNIATTFSELYLPARSLPYGIYQIQLNITIIGSLKSTILKYIYIQINPSGITANLVQLGTSMITNGHEKDLILDPGRFSVDPDVNIFNSSLWKYKYYCRIYALYKFPTAQSDLLTIDDPRNDSANPACLLNRSVIKYGDSIQSSVTILGKSLPSNQTYQFMVQMENRKNASIQATGYVLVKVEDTRPQLIAIGCVISPMCIPNLEYQLINPTTQVALFSICIGNCTTLQNITWKIYTGSMNILTNDTQWTLLNQQSIYENIWFFGMKTSNFTAINQLFLLNPHINLWRFQVIYSFLNSISSSALNFIVNQPPTNGSCSISSLNGTTSTIFTISCINWFDEDGIKDYAVYSLTKDMSIRTMIAFSFLPKIQVRLPTGDDQNSSLQIIIRIRDQLDCTTEFNLSSVHVISDLQQINNLIDTFQNSSIDITTNPVIQLLTTGNQNTIGQVLTSVSKEFNKINIQNVVQAVSDGISFATIAISSLTSQRIISQTINQTNQTILNEFNQELNFHAAIREYLLPFTINLPITTSNSIILQSSTLAQLTQATNQLTRTFLINASEKCYRLSVALVEISTRIAYEDAQTAVTQLIQCGSNILTAVNGPLQQRTTVLDLDLSSTSDIQEDYDSDLESPNPNLFANEINRNLFYQKQTAIELTKQLTEMNSLLTSVLNLYLNIGQNSTMNTTQIFMSLQTTSIQSLSNQEIKQIGQATFRLPTNLTVNINNNSTVSIRSMMKPLASFGSNSKSSLNTNVSTSVSLSILDQNGNEINVKTNNSHPIEILIPRDPNFILPAMILQNVTSNNVTSYQQLFQYHYVNLTDTNSISVHLEIHPLDSNLSYLLIYKFDGIPRLNDSINQIDGWTIFYPNNLSNDNIYTYFLDNEQTKNHQSLVFGLRELNSSEFTGYNIHPPKINQRHNFTVDYELRIYTSGCYYLNENNEWKSDGLRVGSLTNHQLTQCFSTHLTTFASSFHVLSETVDLMKNQMTYFYKDKILINSKRKSLQKTSIDNADKIESLSSFLTIRDLQTMKKYYFFLQRCICCFVLLFFSVFLNIMYYDLKNNINLKYFFKY